MVNFKQKFKNFSNDLNIQEIRVYRIKKRQKIKHVLVKKNSIIIEEKKKKVKTSMKINKSNIYHKSQKKNKIKH